MTADDRIRPERVAVLRAWWIARLNSTANAPMTKPLEPSEARALAAFIEQATPEPPVERMLKRERGMFGLDTSDVA